MATPSSANQLRNDSERSQSSSEVFIYSSSNAYSSPRSLVESAHQSEPLANLNEFNVVTPTYPQHPKARNNHNENTNMQHILSELHNLQETSSQQSCEYERAIRRVLLENEYVRKINAKLIAKLESRTCEDENIKTSLKKLESVAQCSKELMIELGDGRRDIEERANELDRRNRQLRKELEVTVDKFHKQQIEMDAILSSSRDKAAKLEELEKGRLEMEELVMELRDSLQISSQSYNKLRIELNTVFGEREDARFRVEELLIEKNDEMSRRINAETALAKAKRELNDLRQMLGTVAVRGESTCNNVTAAMEQATSERATEVKQLEQESLQSQLVATTAEISELKAKIKGMNATMEEMPPGDALDAEDETIQYVSKIAELTAENTDLREQVAMLKEGLQDFAKNGRDIVDIPADRDMFALKLKKIYRENEASDLTVLITAKHIGTVNADLNHLELRNEAAQLELVKSREEGSAIENDLTMSDATLEKANASTPFLGCQLKSTDEELGPMTLKFESATDDLDFVKKCIDEFGDLPTPAEPQSGEKHGRCWDARYSNQVSLDSSVAKLESLPDSTAQKGAQINQTSVWNAAKSLVQSFRLQNNDIRMTLACAMNEMEEKFREMSKIESQVKAICQKYQQLSEEIEKASIICDHFQLQCNQGFDAAELKISLLNSELQQKKVHEDLEMVFRSLEKEKENALAHISDLEDRLCHTQGSPSLQQKELQSRVHLLERELTLILSHNDKVASELKTAMEQVASLDQMSMEEKKSNEGLLNFLSNLKVLLDESYLLASERPKEFDLFPGYNAKFLEKLKRQPFEKIDLCRTIELQKKELDDCKLALLTVSNQLKQQNAIVSCMREQATKMNNEIALLNLQKNEAEYLVKEYTCRVRSLCLSRGLLQLLSPSFDEMLVILESECSKQLERTNSMEIELEAVQDENDILEQQVHILSKELSKCTRENRELLAAIAELNVIESTGMLHCR